MTSGSNPSAEIRDEPFEVDVARSETVYNGYVWDVREDTFRYGPTSLVRHYLDHTGAVAVVALDDDDRVLLIQQYRHPIGTRDWEIPAGLLDIEGEDPRDTAVRELAEEADLVADTWEELGSFTPSPGGSSELIHIFLATGVRAATETFERRDEEADIRTAWVPLDDVVQAIVEGHLHNAAMTIGVLLAARRRSA
ncbi:NTP pyrophosphohydrolase [Microbacterium faecale]|uniref:NTP pyrophosphohydrolase n=1 Tax=Microbacterium faecale TaxID=1804630 RepID=A0A917DJE8_9MICO|nr:NUDIX hydrolase [Microbacterium faecale]GGD43354.1 NTP pyrophosphohydrolase [Microbacterium faecale]